MTYRPAGEKPGLPCKTVKKEAIMLIALLFFFFLPGFSSAIDPATAMRLAENPGLRTGPFDLHPYFALKEIYSDNIYYTPDNEKSDFITSFQPGLIVQFPFRQHLLSVEANITPTVYASYSSENTTDYYVDGLANFILGDRMHLALSDTYVKGHESRSQSATGLIEKYGSNAALSSLTYLLAEVSKIKVDYTATSWDYETSEFRSRNEGLVSAYVYYRLHPKTSVFGEFDFKQVDFDDESLGLDNEVYTAQVGLTWEFAEGSRGTLKGGYLWKIFDQASQGRLGTWTGSLDLTHEFSDINSVKLAGKRDVNEANLLGTRYYITTGLYGEFAHKFLDRLSGVVKGSYSKDKYSDIASGDSVIRKDRVYFGGAGVRYLFRRWMELELEYNYREKHSNIDSADYSENALMLTLKAGI